MDPTSTGQSETRIGRHPLIWYFALAYAISWPLWVLSHLAGRTLGSVFIVIGGFGPMLAAAIIISRTGGSLSEWLRSILRWRVSPVYYAYALGLPVLLAVILNLTLAALGEQPDLSLVVERIPAYVQTFLLTAVIFGGQEEPGWRGFALPRLQQRHAPLVATLLLGLGWGIWQWCRWCSLSTTRGCTTRPAAFCCASCCMPASPPPKIICC
jgi:membrane protease YdiL (CAAX protease family)